MYASSESTVIYTSSEETTTLNSSESTTTCNNESEAIVSNVQMVVLIICLVLVTATLVLILSNRRLRKQHNIFPSNLMLADLLGVVTFMVRDSMRLVSGEEVRIKHENKVHVLTLTITITKPSKLN